MRILPVNFTSDYTPDKYDYMYLYRPRKSNKDKFIKRYVIATAMVAASAVAVALVNISRKRVK